MADWSLPGSTTEYTLVITYFKDRDLDIAKGLDPALVTVTNPIAGMQRWTSASNKWERYNGSTWVDLTTTYNIDVAYFGGQTPSYYAPINNPTFTGNQIGTTQALDNNTTRLATTQFVLNQRGTATPLVDGTASAGTSYRYSAQDHRHPTDTTRAPLASPTFTGTVTAPAFSGPLTGNVTGNVSGSSGSCTGNANTATTSTNQSGGTVNATSGTITTANITTANITNLTGYSTSGAGTYRLLEVVAENSVTSTIYTKVIEWLVGQSGTIDVTFSLDNNAGGTAYGRIYVNGIAVGTERISSSGTPAAHQEIITIVKGDLLQIYARNSSSGGTSNITSAYINCDSGAIAPVFLSISLR